MTDFLTREKRGIFLYILIAILFSAVCWLTAQYLANQVGVLLPTQENFFALRTNGYQTSYHRWIGFLFRLATYGPLLAAIIAITVESGKVGVLDLLKRIVRWRVRWTWYLATVLLSVGITLIPAAIARLTGLAGNQPLFTSAPMSFILALFIVQLFSSGLGEEVGWRGYLLPKLQKTMQGERALWMLGIIWAVWHYPFVIALFLTNMADLPLAARLVTIPASLAGFTITIIGSTFLHAWLYNNTQSILLSVLFHALSNTCAVVFGAGALAASPLAILPGIMPWVAVVAIRWRFGREAFLLKSIA